MDKNYEEILDYLEKSYTGARAMDDDEAQLRIARAIAAFAAPTDIDIFTKEYEKIYYTKQTEVDYADKFNKQGSD